MLFPHPEPSIGRKKSPNSLPWLTKPSTVWPLLASPTDLFTHPALPSLLLLMQHVPASEVLHLSFSLLNFLPTDILLSGSLHSFRLQSNATSPEAVPTFPVQSHSLPVPSLLPVPS